MLDWSSKSLTRSRSASGQHGREWIRLIAGATTTMTLLFAAMTTGRGDDAEAQMLAATYQPEIQPLLKRFCFECHAGDRVEAEIDLSESTTFEHVRKRAQVWQKLGEMLDSQQMPPKDAKQPSDAERATLQKWVRRFLTHEAKARSGDPGRVVLRRLSNSEYTYTLRDLTGISSLQPAREFPVDGAAGEGFTNTGNALVMSPALVTKYLDAAKVVTAHAILLPDGIRFSDSATRSDWTNETLDKIRQFYSQFTDASGGERVNLQGIVFDTNQGGRLPVEKYLLATLTEREALRSGRKSVADVAREQRLNAKYLGTLWQALSEEKPAVAKPDVHQSSLLLDELRARWAAAKAEDLPSLVNHVMQWQKALWKFSSVGHIGKVGGPKGWLEPVSPLVELQELRLKMPVSADGQTVTLYLTTGDAGDGLEHDFAVWERPRLVAPGRPDLLLRDVRAVTQELAVRRERVFAMAAKCLAAADEANRESGSFKLAELAQKHGVDAESLAAWLDYLGIGAGGAVALGTPITGKLESVGGYDFVKGWSGSDALSVLANSSDQAVRIPGHMQAHSIAVHPAPTLSVAVGWRSPVAAKLKISGVVQHAHAECGNGIQWTLELRRGNTRHRLATGPSQGAKAIPLGPFDNVAVQPGDVISLVINPKDRNHSCDLTAIDLTLNDGSREWNMARDLSSNILAGNPHADGLNHKDVWNFYSEPASGATGHVIVAGSLLARWQAAVTTEEKSQLGQQVQQLLQAGVGGLAKDSPDVALHQQLTSLSGPLLSSALKAVASKTNPEVGKAGASTDWGLDPAKFGRYLAGPPIDPASLSVRAPEVVEVKLPADLVAGSEFVTTARLHPTIGDEGSVQMQVLTAKPESTSGLKASAAVPVSANGPWTSASRGVTHATPIITMPNSASRKRIEASFSGFRSLFPAALCYTKIVPVDEVVTLTLFYREDDQLQRLMLNESQRAELDRLWNELHFISHDAEILVDALEQLIQFATQDADPKVFEPLRIPFNARADAFRKQLVDTQPTHVAAVLKFAQQAFRRPLSEVEERELRMLYQTLRKQEIGHDDAIRLMLARVLVAPAFLYRIEKPVTGPQQGPVTDFELASRLSYFLWSSQPDDTLRQHAQAKRLTQPETLKAETQRLLRDPKARRLATEFACQWLHIKDFENFDEKSETHFPTFAALRTAMSEESILFFTDLFQNDGSVLSLLDADHTFLNADLAKHYGIPGVAGPEYRRVEGVKKHSRGGILTLGTTLSTQAGASRTSPILRGNWLSEVVLGEKLPRPPKNVPQLPETVPSGLTERQLIERHSVDEACSKCHLRIDPFGFALENFDAIGRYREKDATGLAIDTATKLPDGTQITGLGGLREYLLTKRRTDFLRQFNKKLLGFALGRAVQLSDELLLTEMRTELEKHDYRISAAIHAIVHSRQFREIRSQHHALDDE